MLANQRQLPQTYQDNLARAVEILKADGCTEVYLALWLWETSMNAQILI